MKLWLAFRNSILQSQNPVFPAILLSRRSLPRKSTDSFHVHRLEYLPGLRSDTKRFLIFGESVCSAPNDEYLTLPCIPFARFRSKNAPSNASGGNFDMRENGARRIIKLNPVWDKSGSGPGFTWPLKETIGSLSKDALSDARQPTGSEAFVCVVCVEGT